MTSRITLLSLTIFILCCCSGHIDDPYLASLPGPQCTLTPRDSLDLEQFEILLPTRLIKYDRWAVFEVSQAKSNLVLLNMDSMRTQEAVMVGRGPGEMKQGGDLHLEGSRAVLTEANTLTQVSIDLASVQEGRIPVLDTIGTFKNCKNATGRLRRVHGGFVSMVPYYNTLEEGAWYSLWDEDGYVSAPILRPVVEGLNKLPQNYDYFFFRSSIMAVHPSQDRLCVAHPGMAVLSFSAIEDRTLREVKRIEYNKPVVISKGDQNTLDYEKSYSCFRSVSPDKEYVYLLYSGKMVRSSGAEGMPDSESNHLLVYDWAGNLAARYYLSRNVSSIFVEGNELYCISLFPSSKLFVYSLPEC